MEDTNYLSWRKSSYSGNGGANCVEVGKAGRVLVRDTKQAGTGPVLRFSPGAWRRFAELVKRSLGHVGEQSTGLNFSKSSPSPGFESTTTTLLVDGAYAAKTAHDHGLASAPSLWCPAAPTPGRTRRR